MTGRYTGSRGLAARLWPPGLVRRLLGPLGRHAQGGAYVEYLLIAGICAFGLIHAWRKFRAHAAVQVHNQARIVRTMDAPDPAQALADLGGLLQVREPPVCQGNTCWIPGIECFAAGTLVATETGDRPIETIRIGDRVWAQDPTTRIAELRPVVRRSVTPWAKVVNVSLTTALGTETLTVTPDHLFWAEGQGWVAAQELATTPLLSLDSNVSATAVATTAVPTTVYNLEVEGLHTYFVGASHAWVHNDDCDFDPQTDCIDKVLALPHTRYKKRRAELEALCNSKQYRFNPDTGRLRDINAGNYPPPISEPCFMQSGNTYAPSAPFASSQQALFDERAEYLCPGPNYDKAAGSSISQTLGENAADEYGEKHFKNQGWDEVPADELGARAHAYDKVYTRTNPQTGEFEVVIIEAKGGTSGLGTRWEDLGPGASTDPANRNRVQQGTLEYAKTIANAMRRDPARAIKGQQILDALEDGNARYLEVRQSAGNLDCNSNPPKGAAGPIEVGEFAIYEEDRQANPSCD